MTLHSKPVIFMSSNPYHVETVTLTRNKTAFACKVFPLQARCSPEGG